MPLAFPLADPDAGAAEAGRLAFASGAEFLKGVAAMSGLPPSDRPEVCFAGRSNVGKSSLINALCGRRGPLPSGNRGLLLRCRIRSGLQPDRLINAEGRCHTSRFR